MDLSKFFTREAIIDVLSRLPELKTPVMDLLYTDRRNHPFPVVGYRDLNLPAGNIPVVRRGSQSYPLNPTDGKISMIEVQPVNPSVYLSAADLNNMKLLDPQGQQVYIDNQIDNLRRACRATAEALAAQSLTGKIAYPLRADGGTYLTYEVDYGTPVSVTVTKKWDDANTKVSDIVKSLGQIMDELKKTAPAMDVVFLCGFDVYAALVEKIGALPNSAIAQVGADYISIGGVAKIQLLAANYIDLTTGNAVSSIPAKTILAVDRSSGFKLLYAALDQMETGLVALPFFARPVPTQDPSGVKIVAESKPLPVPNVKGIVKAVVLI